MNMRKIIAVLAAALMLCSVIPFSIASVSAAEAPVYLADFESGSLGGWKNDAGGMSIAPSSELPVANSACGNYVVKKVKPANDWGFLEDRKGFTVEPNTDYLVTVDVLPTANYPFQAFVSTGTWISGVLGETGSVTCSANQWTTLSFVFNSGNNTKVYASFKSPWDKTTYYMDNFKVVKLDPYRNLINNGDFETGSLTGWTKHQQTVAVEGAAAYKGNYGLHIQDNGTWGGIMEQTIAVEAGKTYEISFWIKVNKRGINLQIKDGGDSGASLASGTWYDIATHSEWTQKTYTVTPTTNGIYLKFCGAGDDTPDAADETDTYIDNFSLKLLKDPSFDGYLYNGDFETGKTSHWTALWGDTVLEIVEGGHNGDYALKGTASKAWAITYQEIAVEPNTDYIVFAWAKDATNAALWTKGVDSAGEHDLKSVSFAAGSEWKQYSVEINSGAYTKVWIGLMGLEAGATYTVDDVLVLKKIAPSDDGYIYNGNFESGKKESFVMDQQTVVSIDAAKDGNFGAHLKGVSWGGLLGYTFNVEPGATYELYFDAKANVNGFNYAVLADTWQGAQLAGGTFNKTAWTTVKMEFVPTTNKCYLNMNGYSADAQVDCYVDNVRVVKTKDAHVCEFVGVETKAPTCTEDGVKTFSCSCGEGTYTEAIPALGHTPGAAADCVNAQVCTVCSAELVAALGHTWDDATCTAPKTCSVCHATEGEALGHTYDHAYDINCNVCGAVRSVANPITFAGASAMEMENGKGGLAMSFTMDIEGIAIKDNTWVWADFTNATYNGDKLLEMGVVASNGTSSTIIKGERMYDLEGTVASFAFRITNVPAEKGDVTITMTPYFIVEIDGVATTIYGEAQSATYNELINN